MTGLDTNVLVRYLTGDDVPQSAAVDRLVRESRESGEPLFVPLIVLCETVWVLARGYGYTREEIATVLELLLRTEGLFVERDGLARRALARYRAGPGDLADYLIGLVALDAGCKATATFDRKLRGAAEFRLL